MISEEQIKHIAKLARINIDDEKIKKFSNDLSSVLDYVEKLKQADISNIEETTHALDLKNVLRDDSAVVCDPSVIQIIKDDFVAENGDYLKVKSVFNNGD